MKDERRGSGRAGRRRATSAAWASRSIATALWLVSLCVALPASAQTPVVYHSPFDDGAYHGAPTAVAPGGDLTFHLYLGIGHDPSSADPCHRGDGEEICGHRIELASSGLVLRDFTPAEPDLLYTLSDDALRLTGGDPVTGQLGPTKLGDLTAANGIEGGRLELIAGEFVDARLSTRRFETPRTVVSLPEPAGSIASALAVGLIALLHRRRARRSEAIPRTAPRGRPRGRPAP